MKHGNRNSEVKPVAYMETGMHASFPKFLVIGRSRDYRSTGVQSTARTGTARSRQTQNSQHCSPPLDSHSENAKWCGMRCGLSKNHSSNNGLQWPNSSVLRHVLAHATG